jgi:hypothetical protein
MKREFIIEAKRFQELAGISEMIKVNNPIKNKDLFNIINSNKSELARKFNLNIGPLMVSGGDEDESVQISDDNGYQVDFIKTDNWESNKGLYSNNQEIGKITLGGINLVYVVNQY